MGYSSDVLIAIAFSSVEHRDEVWSVYCIDPRVQKYKLARAWKNFDGGPYPALWYHAEYVIWYDNYEDVQAVEHMLDLVSGFAQERGLPYAYICYRLGEDTPDIETTDRYAPDAAVAMHDMLLEHCGISRRLEHNFT